MKDAFGSTSSSLTSPATYADNVTPSDDAELEHASRALYIGGAGDLRVDMMGGGVVTFTGVPAGSVLPLRVRKVFKTGTTAANIIALR